MAQRPHPRALLGMLATLLLVALLLPSPAVVAEDPSAYPFTFTDDSGRAVTLEAPPRRVVSLGPSNTEILYAIGAGDRLVGVDVYSDYPPEVEGLPKVGQLLEPDFERIVALRPDLVLLINLSQEHQERLRALGLNAAHINAATLADVYDRILLLGRALDREDEARRVVEEMQRRIEAVRRRVASVPPADRPRVFYEVWPDPLMTAGPGSFIHDVIELAGGENVAADAPAPWPAFSLESLVERAPQVILTPFAESVQALREDGRPGWSGFPAVRAGRIHLVDQDVVGRPGPRVAQAVEELAALFYPERFGREEAP
ncbi:iron ABC transporter substrate-binding protein [Limnochorda pilosa]|uniref:Iron ABC transporter substrate-binding protein n=2 Tax=Limnochorda pilosa TaxID=1555112 RepID=A0A0K2SQB8_LIMPI|nr:iron ABC transporter substrate-binding protein [Limnochorda pilosa]